MRCPSNNKNYSIRNDNFKCFKRVISRNANIAATISQQYSYAIRQHHILIIHRYHSDIIYFILGHCDAVPF